MSLPGILGDVERIAGVKAALRLASLRGGTRISISDRPGSALVEVLGADVAGQLVRQMGGGEVTVPMAHTRGQKGRRAAAAAMIATGASPLDVAIACDIHERTYFRVKARLEDAGDQDQGDLFGPTEDKA